MSCGSAWIYRHNAMQPYRYDERIRSWQNSLGWPCIQESIINSSMHHTDVFKAAGLLPIQCQAETPKCGTVVDGHLAKPHRAQFQRQLQRLYKQTFECCQVNPAELREGRKSGSLPATSMRKAMSSVNRFSIRRDEKTPMQ